jgi:hypothetical protein
MLDLATEIAAMFAGLDGYERYAAALEIAGTRRRAEAVERTAQWRAANPEKFLAQRRKWKRAWEARHPDKHKASRSRQRKARRAKDLDAARKLDAQRRAQWRRDNPEKHAAEVARRRLRRVTG